MGANLVKSDRNRAVRTIHGSITNSGAVAVAQGAGYTAVRNGAGDVTITLSRPGRRLLSASAMVINATAATAHAAKALAASASAIQFGTYAADGVDGVPADVDFTFSITVSDTAQ